MTRYLLGELSEQEQAALEERYFSDPNVFDEMLQVESELVDAYARGQLSIELRERFEQSYLKHPARRKRVEFARALTSRIEENERSTTREQTVRSPQRLWTTIVGRRPALRFAMALVIVLIALASVWVFVNRRQRIQAQRENQKQPEQTAQQPTVTPVEKQQDKERVAQIPPSPNSNINSAPSIVSLALSVGSVRGAGATPTLIIPPDTIQAQILLNLKDDSYPRYRVSLQKIGGSEIFTQTNIRPRSTKAGARFVFTIPARQFTSGDYTLILEGVTPAGEVDSLDKSLFRVEKSVP